MMNRSKGEELEACLRSQENDASEEVSEVFHPTILPKDFGAEVMGRYYIDHELAVLALRHPNANRPDEPYSGVTALFNADLHATEPDYAPRQAWTVLSPHVIKLNPVTEEESC